MNSTVRQAANNLLQAGKLFAATTFDRAVTIATFFFTTANKKDFSLLVKLYLYIMKDTMFSHV